MVILSAYEAICMFLGGCGMSCMNRLKSVGGEDRALSIMCLEFRKYHVLADLLLKITNDRLHDR